MKKIIYPISVFFILFISLFLGLSVKASTPDTFSFQSVNQDSTLLYTMTIVIDEERHAEVWNEAAPLSPGASWQAVLAGRNLATQGGAEDTADLDVLSMLPGDQLFYVEVEMEQEPEVQNGGPVLLFWCESYNCTPPNECEITMLISGNKANLQCTQTCKRCKLRHRSASPGNSVHDGGGAYIVAKTVTYR